MKEVLHEIHGLRRRLIDDADNDIRPSVDNFFANCLDEAIEFIRVMWNCVYHLALASPFEVYSRI